MKLAIVHQLPLEYYPPVTNILSFLDSEGEMAVSVYSTTNQKHRVDYRNATAKIHRSAYALPSMNILSRWWAAVRWHLGVAKRLAAWKPDVVLYYEPHSAFVVCWYFLRYRGSAKLFIHHHEYYEPSDYLATGNRMTRLNHFFEKRYLLNRAVWISQTNEKRLALFQQDHPSVKPNQLRVLPNYPPREWSRQRLYDRSESPSRPASNDSRIRLVYVGSVSLHDTFIGPLVEWILSRGDDAVTLDVFAYNADEKTKVFLREASGERREARGALMATEDVLFSTTDPGLQTPNSGLKPHASPLKPSARVRYFEEGVDYDDLPKVLADYDVGVILYRCNTTNYKFNASNKLFEYLACGLEVWYPPQMQGVKPYARDDMFPRVLEVDFERLDKLDLDRMANANGLPDAPPPPCCEDEFGKLMDEFKKLGARS